MNNDTKLVWLDLEMTGLNPDNDVILEIATIITDSELHVIELGPHIIINQPTKILDNMDEWCKKIHTKSGLIQAVKQSTINTLQAEQETLKFIKKHCKPQTGLLSGNSIWSDRAFLRVYMPLILEYLHYKGVDVRSIAKRVSTWYADDPNNEFKKKDEHRALTDILESIEQLKHLRKHFFRKV